MPIPVEVPGLDAFIPEVPEGRLVLLEGGLAPAKSALARRVLATAQSQGRAVRLLSTRPAEGETLPATEVSSWPSEWPAADVAVDSFSLLHLGTGAAEVADRLRRMRKACAANGTVAVLVLDDGQMEPAAVAAAHHLADGVVQFRARDDPEGAIPYLRVPKWMARGGTERNVYYGFDGEALLVDTRRRVN